MRWPVNSVALVYLVFIALFTVGTVAAATPDFDAYVEVEPASAGPGRVSGLVRNVSDGPMRNIVLRVRHRWHWSGGRYDHTDNATVSRVLVSGEPAGFASVHLPPAHVPEHASYDYDVAVIELRRIRLAPR